MYCYVFHRFRVREGTTVIDDVVQPRQHAALHDGAPRDFAPVEKLIHLALPVRLIHMQNGERVAQELACTYDIYRRGARLLSSREVRRRDLVTRVRERTKSVGHLVW